MSGGSFNYLCFKESYDIHEKREELEQMRDRLVELGYLDAAKETESVLLTLDSFYLRLDARLDRFKGVWKAVEWSDSGDWNTDDIVKEIDKYRDKI